MKENLKLLKPTLNMMIFGFIVPLLILATQTSAIAVSPQINAGGYNTTGLNSDGTVVAAGDNEYGQSDIADWTDIVQLTVGVGHTVGLKSDGKAVAVS